MVKTRKTKLGQWKIRIDTNTKGKVAEVCPYPGGCAQSSCLTGVDALCSPLVALCQEHNNIYTRTYTHTQTGWEEEALRSP